MREEVKIIRLNGYIIQNPGSVVKRRRHRMHSVSCIYLRRA